MPRRSLVEHRPWLLLGLAAAILYYFVTDDALGEVWQIAIKFVSIAALACYAFYRHSSMDAKILSGVLVLAAFGHALMELYALWAGIAFFMSYCAAIALYMRHRRANPVASQVAFAIALLIATPLLGWLFTKDSGVFADTLILGGMGFAAWLSAFSRYRVGIGAVMIVIAELLLFWQAGALDNGGAVAWAYWPLVYAGHFLIATGVIQTLRHELPED